MNKEFQDLYVADLERYKIHRGGGILYEKIPLLVAQMSDGQ